MHVISGKYKGMKLITLPGDNTRPTLTRVKEDAFNIINNYFIFEGKKSLDIFGGSGALTIEGISRGISEALINDYSLEALGIIKLNLSKTRNERVMITNLDYLQLIESLQKTSQSFDLIYLDPPFAKVEVYEKVFDMINTYKIIKKWGIMLVESENLLDSKIFSKFILLKHKAYNKKNLYILRMENEY